MVLLGFRIRFRIKEKTIYREVVLMGLSLLGNGYRLLEKLMRQGRFQFRWDSRG